MKTRFSCLTCCYNLISQPPIFRRLKSRSRNGLIFRDKKNGIPAGVFVKQGKREGVLRSSRLVDHGEARSWLLGNRACLVPFMGSSGKMIGAGCQPEIYSFTAMPLEADSRVDTVLAATFFFCMIGLIGLRFSRTAKFKMHSSSCCTVEGIFGWRLTSCRWRLSWLCKGVDCQQGKPTV